MAVGGRNAIAAASSAAAVLIALHAPLAHAAPGDLVCSFGGGSGYLRTDLGGAQSESLALRMVPSGSLRIAGRRLSEGTDALALAQITPDGALDPEFGDVGRRLNSVGAEVVLENMVHDDLGRALAAGSTYGTAGDPAATASENFLIARFDAEGLDDLSFADSGTLEIDFAAGLDYATSIAVQDDGVAVMGGVATVPGGTDVEKVFALARVLANGSLDPDFGSAGRLTTRIGDPDIWDESGIVALEVLPDHRILAAGWVFSRSFDGSEMRGALVLARYLNDGTLDINFGDGGIVITDVLEGEESPSDLHVDAATGEILVFASGNRSASTTGTGNQDWILVRYDANGALDSNFGAGGIVIQDWGGDLDRSGRLAIDATGRIYAGGSTESLRAGMLITGQGRLARFLPNGALDGSFSPMGAGLPEVRYTALLLAPEGDRLWAVGSMADSDGERQVLAAAVTLMDGPSTRCTKPKRRSGGALGLALLSLFGLAAASRRRNGRMTPCRCFAT